MLTGFTKGANAWVHAWTRGRIEALQAQAAFAVALGEEMPIEPISGKPFVFDPASNTVMMPVDPPPNGFELKPVKVPAVTR
jgi:hypothetical protein